MSTQPKKRLDEIMGDLLQDSESGVWMVQSLRMLAKVERSSILRALEVISTEETIGPMVDPTKWRNTDAFTKAKRWRELLEILLKLRDFMESKNMIIKQDTNEPNEPQS